MFYYNVQTVYCQTKERQNTQIKRGMHLRKRITQLSMHRRMQKVYLKNVISNDSIKIDDYTMYNEIHFHKVIRGLDCCQ